MSFGKRVAFIRERNGMFQKELAKEIGISAHKLSDYEREISSPKDEIKIKIAQTLDISMDYLMGLTDDIVSYEQKNSVVLPKDFPKEAIPKVTEYINLLMSSKQK